MNFDQCFQLLMGDEGGFVDNPADPGGATCWGVTERVARAHGYTGPMQDLPQATAKAIAKVVYWDPHQCDQFDGRVGFLVFDAAYNGGQPAQWLQRAVGVTQDGVVGPVTIAAVKALDPLLICLRFSAYHQQYYTSLDRLWPELGKGWSNRIANNNLAVAAAS